MTRAELHADYLVKLCAAAIHEREVPMPSFELDSLLLVKLISAHHLSGLLYPVLKDSSVLCEESLEILRLDFRTDQMRDVSQDDALDEITEAFVQNNIQFVVLKGIVLKRFYNKSFHRMMGDLDLLVRESDRANARAVMESLGFTTESYDQLYDDVYYRRPFLNVEVHVKLGNDEDAAHPYFSEVWNRVVPDPCCKNRFCMSPEDYYLYFIQHAVKHCKHHGTGIRTLIDFWYVRKKFLPTLNRSEVNAQLEKFQNLQFEKEFYDLCDVWFDGKIGDSFQTKDMLHFLVLNSGLYGNFSNTMFHRVMNDADVEKSHAKKRSLFLRNIFPTKERMAAKYPILNRAPFLLPICWLIRAVKTLFAPKKIKTEMRLYSDVTNGLELHTKLYSRFGFFTSSDSEGQS